MWTKRELSRIGKTFIDGDNNLESICDSIDLGIFKKFFKIYTLFKFLNN